MKGLKDFYKDLPEDRRLYAEKICDRLQYIEAKMDEMEKRIDSDGVAITHVATNGAEVIKEHPLLRQYTVLSKEHSSKIRQLVDLLPEEVGTQDELMAFLEK